MDNTNANIDLIRSHVDIIILKPLESQDRYGYEILREIETNSNGLFNLKQPTMYSCLKRLEKQGYIRSYLGDESNGAQRRYYALTGQGRDFLESQQNQWEFVRTVLSGLVSSEDFDKEKDVKPFDPSKYRPLTKRTRSEDDDNENVKIVEKIIYVPVDKNSDIDSSSSTANTNAKNDNSQVEKYIDNIADNETNDIDDLTEYLNDNVSENVFTDGSANVSFDECDVKVEENMYVSQDSLSYLSSSNSVSESVFNNVSNNISDTSAVNDNNDPNSYSEKKFDQEYIDESYDLTQNDSIVEDNIDFIEEFNAESTEDVFDKIEPIEESVNEDYKEEFSEAYYEEELSEIATESFDTYESNIDSDIDTDESLLNNSITKNGSSLDDNASTSESVDDSPNDNIDSNDLDDENIDDSSVTDTVYDDNEYSSTTSKREEWLEHYNYQNIKYSTYQEEDDENNDVSTDIKNDESYNNDIKYTTSSDVKLDADSNDYEREINLFSVLDNIYTKNDNSVENSEYDEETIKPRSADYSSTADSENSRPMHTINDLKIKLKNEGFNVKPYTKINSSEYYINNYYYCNRTGRDASIIMYVLLFFESMIAHFALAKNYNLPFWSLPIVWVSLAVIPTVAIVIWSISPYHKKRTRVSLRLSLLIALIALLNLALVILLIGFFGFGADYRDVTTMMLPIIVPLIFLLNIPLYSLIYYLLYKTKRYNLR